MTARLGSSRARSLLPDPAPRCAEAVGERALRPPAEVALRGAGIEDAALQLAEPGLGARGAVVDAAAVVLRRAEDRVDDVADVDVVPRLPAVAVDRRRPPVGQQ